MNQRQRFIRKIVYGCVIVVLLLPVYWLSHPETKVSKGGRLAQLRSEYQLGQAQLGDIDPASETIKLATLGLRGVAVNLLWEQANEYRKTKDWVNLSATLQQIAKLQPNFVSVWIFQGWNLSYNISVEFDDYRDRYYWVIKGIDYLKEGTQYNRDEPRLLSKIGWTIANKIGRADEHVQYRRLFRDDDQFNADVPRTQRDNWLVGRQWMLKAEDAVARGVPIRGESPLLFYSHPVMCLVNYAEAIEEEGRFGEVAKNAWRRAAEAWAEYSSRDLPTQYNLFIRLADKEGYDQQLKQSKEELEKLAPGLREKIAEEHLASLTDEERRVRDLGNVQLSQQDQQIAYNIYLKMEISDMEIADRVTGPNRAAALKAAEESLAAERMSQSIDVERGIVNYDYWRLRCEIEPEDDTLEARRLIFDADEAFLKAQLVSASESYAKGFEKWRKVIDKYPRMLADSNFTELLVESIDRYKAVLGQLSEKLPEPFVLQDVLDAQGRGVATIPAADKPAEASAEANDPAAPTP